MPLYRQLDTPHLRWAIWQYGESLDELRRMLPSDYPDTPSATGEARLREWLTVRVLLYRMLGVSALVRYAESGRPRIESLDDPPCVSISHTRGYAAVAVSGEEVGIDIEYLHPRVERIADRFLSPAELDDVRALPAAERALQMLLYWSGKETVYKRLGRTGVDFRRQLRFHPSPDGIAPMTCDALLPDASHCLSVSFLTTPDFVLTWA
ncbi:MAG: 4'-phosphopantetheinyl transferase superfamily protein [Prevotellaceae bacterium]|jgi:phosphopantetheinyl transferase|nr:4'-phosphopantetheinyl transferase superfamily protein [Prevotellaceae bacterium]